MERVLGDDQATDDIAILTATLNGLPLRPPYDVREWCFASSDARTATLVRHQIGDLVAGWTARNEAVYESELVFGELFSNVVRHAPGPLHVRAAQTAEGAELVVTDAGPGFGGADDATEPFAESGRGLQLVRALAAAIVIEAHRPGTRVHVAFARAAAAFSAGTSSALSSA
jgi:anti-sigma regulatory factor (Ser/Thr protein kinase)